MITEKQNYSKAIQVNASSKSIFSALTENLHKWWGAITNANFKAGGHFTVTFHNGYWWTFEIVEYHPDQELIWKCIDGEPEFNKEWIGHILHWKIDKSDTLTQINFHQVGLTPDTDCYSVCSSTWDRFITEELKEFLVTDTKAN